MRDLPLVETYRGTVLPWHCDHMNHMNVMWYVGKFDEGTWNLLSMIGVTSAYMRDEGRAMAAVEQRLQYKRELVAGDTIVVRSGISEVRPKAMLFFHEMRNAVTDEIAATSRYVGVHMDSKARRAVPFPPSVADRAQAFLREYDFGDR